MIDPKKFITNKQENKYESFKKLDSSYMCQQMGCGQFSSLVYRDDENGLIIWVCPNQHENKAKLAFDQ